MRFLIAVDCEGSACVVGQSGKTITESRNFPLAVRQAGREADAAVRALFDAGADQVVVWDNHNGSLNLDYEALDRRVDILLGTGSPHGRCPILDEGFDGMLLIGYHPMEGTPNGVLAHTYSSSKIQWMKINGREVGEIAIDAALAGETNVPVILVSSDNHAITETGVFLPWAETVMTKRGLGWNMALSNHPRRVTSEIYDATARAVSRLDEMEPFMFETPFRYEVRYKRMDQAEAVAKADAAYTRIDGFTVERRATSVKDVV